MRRPCPACGAELAEGAESCAACGVEINSPTVNLGAPGETRLERDAGTLAEGTTPSQPITPAPGSGTVWNGRYEIEGLIGAGGMGTVYKAYDQVLGETVALKLLKADLLADASLRERFKSEIRLARKVRHPNVCSIYEFGESDQGPFLSMELVQGSDLKHILRGRALPPGQALAIAIQVAEGLQAVHDVGIVHRDLKCANVMVDAEGRVRLMDFGIAKREGDSKITTGQMVLGTPDYMSPEQAQAKPVSARSDVYSLGVVIFELFTGQLPFTASSPLGVALKHVQEEPPLADPLLPPAVRGILGRALAKSPSARYATARAVANALREAQQEAAGPAVATLARAPSPSRVWPGVIVIVVLAAAAAAFILLRPGTRSAASTPGPPVSTGATLDAQILVLVRPWGELLIDGRSVGTTPLDYVTVSPGTHVVRVRHPSLGAKEQTVVLQSGERKKIEVDLTAPKTPAPR